jgi:hypothetical protein
VRQYGIWIVIGVMALSLALVLSAGATRDAAPLYQGATPTPVVPLLVSYQGRVSVSGVPYNSTGYFKFAIERRCIGESAAWNWSNDGTVWSLDPPTEEPATSIAISVTNGYFAHVLGSTNALPVTLFDCTGYLRVWFSSDNVTFERLLPETLITASPYAFRAERVDWSGVQNAPGTATPQPTATPASTATPQPTATPITFSSNPGAASSPLQSNASGYVQLTGIGVGTAAAATDLANISLSSAATSGTYNSLKSVMSHGTWSSDSSADVRAGFFYVGIGGNKNLSTGRGLFGQALHGGSGNVSNLQGLSFSATNNAAGGITNLSGMSVASGNYGTGLVSSGIAANASYVNNSGNTQSAYGNYSAVTRAGGIITTAYGSYIAAITGGNTNYALYTNAGLVRIGDATQAMTITPLISATYDLGSSALAWNKVHAKQYLTYSYGDWTQGVKLQTGETVSCAEAMARLRPSATATVKTADGQKPHLDYTTIPAAAFVKGVDEWQTQITRSDKPDPGAVSSSPVFDGEGKVIGYDNIYRVLLKGADGADMDVMQSVMLCAAREMDAKNKTIEARLAAIEKTLAELRGGKLP